MAGLHLAPGGEQHQLTMGMLAQQGRQLVAQLIGKPRAPGRMRHGRDAQLALRSVVKGCQQQLNTNTGLKKQRLNTDTPNVFHFCPSGAVKVVAAKSSMLKRLVFLFDSDPLVFAG